MKKLDPIGLDELLAFQADQPDGFTAYDVADKMGVSMNRAREIMRQHLRHGRVRYVGIKTTYAADGRACGRLPVYEVAK